MHNPPYQPLSSNTTIPGPAMPSGTQLRDITMVTPPLYKSHPLYSLRRLLLINALIGLILAFFATFTAVSYTEQIWALGMLAMIVSGVIAALDLCIWVKKKHNEELTAARWEQPGQVCGRCREGIAAGQGHAGDAVTVHPGGDSDSVYKDPAREKHTWPIKWLMIVEFLFMLALFWFWSGELGAAGGGYYGDGAVVLRVYATMPTLIAFILHAKCWWMEFRQREKQHWRREHDLEGGCAVLARCSQPAQVESGEGSAEMSTSRKRGSIRDTVHQLNREAKQALSSKSWRGPAAFTANTGSKQERQSLLSKHLEDPTNGRREYSSGRDYGSSSVVGQANDMDEEIDDVESGFSEDIDHIEPIHVVRERSHLTPSTSRDSKRISISGPHDAVADKDTMGTPIVEGAGDKHRSTQYVDGDDDDMAVVVKKAKKGKKSKRNAEEEC